MEPNQRLRAANTIRNIGLLQRVRGHVDFVSLHPVFHLQVPFIVGYVVLVAPIEYSRVCYPAPLAASAIGGSGFTRSRRRAWQKGR